MKFIQLLNGFIVDNRFLGKFHKPSLSFVGNEWMTLHPKQQIGSSINRFLNSIEEEKTTQNEFRSKQKEIRQQFFFQPKKKKSNMLGFLQNHSTKLLL